MPSRPLPAAALALGLALALAFAGCAGSIAPYDEAAEPARRAALEAELRARLGEAWDQPVPGLAEADLELGKEVWYKNCDPCHGPHGQGDGPRADRMQPRPTDLLAGRTLSQAGEVQVVRDGSPGTGMPAFGGKLPERHLLGAYRYLLWLRTNPPPPPDQRRGP